MWLFLPTPFPLFLYITLVSYWRKTWTVKTRKNLLQVVQQTRQFSAAPALWGLLTLHALHLLRTEEVGSLTVEELMRKIAVACSRTVPRLPDAGFGWWEKAECDKHSQCAASYLLCRCPASGSSRARGRCWISQGFRGTFCEGCSGASLGLLAFGLTYLWACWLLLLLPTHICNWGPLKYLCSRPAVHLGLGQRQVKLMTRVSQSLAFEFHF